MADETPVTAVTPGTGTSEYAVTKIAMIFSIAAFTVGILVDIVSAFHSAFPNLVWLGALLNGLGIIGGVLAQLGYNKGRVLVKVAAIKSGQ
jgi:hypothetical protein